MLTVADPNEAVNYFKRTVAENPDRADLHRGLGQVSDPRQTSEQRPFPSMSA